MSPAAPRRITPKRALAVLAALLCGCATLESRSLDSPGTSQSISVKSSDRIVFELDDPDDGCAWRYRCDDSDVEVRLDRNPPAKTKVLIRIHRGYDGPSTITFFRQSSSSCDSRQGKTFTVSLYKRKGDVAFWK